MHSLPEMWNRDFGVEWMLRLQRILCKRGKRAKLKLADCGNLVTDSSGYQCSKLKKLRFCM